MWTAIPPNHFHQNYGRQIKDHIASFCYNPKRNQIEESTIWKRVACVTHVPASRNMVGEKPPPWKSGNGHQGWIHSENIQSNRVPSHLYLWSRYMEPPQSSDLCHSSPQCQQKGKLYPRIESRQLRPLAWSSESSLPSETWHLTRPKGF